jgi:hypothetical protein
VQLGGTTGFCYTYDKKKNSNVDFGWKMTAEKKFGSLKIVSCPRV